VNGRRDEKERDVALTTLPTMDTVIDLVDATNPDVSGTKAAGLATLARAGFAVPAAVCITTEFYRRALAASGLVPRLASLATSDAIREPKRGPEVLARLRALVERVAIPDDLRLALHDRVAHLVDTAHAMLIVRASAPYDDGAGTPNAGLHASVVVAAGDADGLTAAVRTCWASLWSEAAWAYRERRGIGHADVAMAVLVQRFVDAERSGVAFSADPVMGDRSKVVIEAGWGTGSAVVSEKLTPDEYRVTMEHGVPVRVHDRPGCHEDVTVWRHGHTVTRAIAAAWRRRLVLTDADVCELARDVKAIERTLQAPVEVEWACNSQVFWTLQVRPITTLAPTIAGNAPAAATVWTRANLEEILPELPSPLALSYFADSLNLMFTAYHAAEGHALPQGARLVSVFHGRPYLNLTLMQHMTEQDGGDASVLMGLYGGGSAAPATAAWAPAWRRGGSRRVRLTREMLSTFFRTPYRARGLIQMILREDAALRDVPLERLSDRALVKHLLRFKATILRPTFARRLYEVVSGQSRAFMALDHLLEAWPPRHDTEMAVKRLATGFGALPNVRMTYRLMLLGALALENERVRAFFTGTLDEPALRAAEATLRGTEFRTALDAFLRDFGHRGLYESDVMSPRFADDPTPVFRVIQLYVHAGVWLEPSRHAAERRRAQDAAADEARRTLRRGHGWLGFTGRRISFAIVCRALQRLLTLRDECHHVTTMLVAHLRRMALEIGRRAVRDGVLSAADDVFFLTWEELPRVLTTPDLDWCAVTQARRRERDGYAELEVPDLLPAGTGIDGGADTRDPDELAGLGVSPGVVTGRVKVFRSIEELRQLPGDMVLVFRAIEPTLSPIFPLIHGMIAETGGLLSHAAILAREYAVPTVVNVRAATRQLRDGDRIELDGATGRVRVLERAAEQAA
jgi:pyruvate,water dikinase